MQPQPARVPAPTARPAPVRRRAAAALGTGALVAASLLAPVLTTAAQADAPACATTTYATFDDPLPSDLSLNGVAAIVGAEGAKALRLTPSEGYKAGSAFTPVTLPADGAFSAFFTFTITDPGFLGADGLVFVVQTQGDSALGLTGSGLGYRGISPSIGVEFDTYNGAGDPNLPQHVGINTNGSVTSEAVVASPVNLTDPEALHRAWVDYDGTTLEVRLSDTEERPGEVLLSKEINLPEILGGASGSATQAHLGFTASTGGFSSAHHVHSWAFRPCYQPLSGLPSVPDVSTPTIDFTSACTVTATATFADPDADNTHTASIDWGDGSSGAATVNQTDGTAGTASGSHTYGSAGTFTVTATVINDDGGADAASTDLTTLNTASDFGAPVGSDGDVSLFKKGRTIPVKITVTDCSGDLVTTLAPTVELDTLVLTPDAPVDEAEVVEVATNGKQMRWSDDHYQYNLSTKRSTFSDGGALTAGTYRLSVDHPTLFAPATALIDLR